MKPLLPVTMTMFLSVILVSSKVTVTPGRDSALAQIGASAGSSARRGWHRRSPTLVPCSGSPPAPCRAPLQKGDYRPQLLTGMSRAPGRRARHLQAVLEHPDQLSRAPCRTASGNGVLVARRSEEHTSELQSLMRISYAVFCLKKKKITNPVTQKKIHHLLNN